MLYKAEYKPSRLSIKIKKVETIAIMALAVVAIFLLFYYGCRWNG